MIAIYPGTFDPATNGHMDMIERCAKKFDTLYVAILNNPNKKCLFTLEERLEMLTDLTRHYPNVKIASFDGLLIDYAKSINADVIVRGLRAVSDYEYEMQMSLCNQSLYPELETLFLVAKTRFSYLSSSIVKEVASLGGNLENFVPDLVREELLKKYNK